MSHESIHEEVCYSAAECQFQGACWPSVYAVVTTGSSGPPGVLCAVRGARRHTGTRSRVSCRRGGRHKRNEARHERLQSRSHTSACRTWKMRELRGRPARHENALWALSRVDEGLRPTPARAPEISRVVRRMRSGRHRFWILAMCSMQRVRRFPQPCMARRDRAPGGGAAETT
jgi:hypothetical protein